MTNRYFGKLKETGERIYITAPSWDCGWYWSFGYLGNAHCHYHLDGVAKGRCLRDALLDDYELAPWVQDNIWTFCELAMTAYALKQTVEVLGHGGSHYSTNPCAEVIKNPDEVTRINTVVLPAVFGAIEKLQPKVGV